MSAGAVIGLSLVAVPAAADPPIVFDHSGAATPQAFVECSPDPGDVPFLSASVSLKDPDSAFVVTGDAVQATFTFDTPIVVRKSATDINLSIRLDPTDAEVAGGVPFDSGVLTMTGTNLNSSLTAVGSAGEVVSNTAQITVTSRFAGPVDGLLVDPLADGIVEQVNASFTIPGDLPADYGDLAGLVEAQISLIAYGECPTTGAPEIPLSLFGADTETPNPPPAPADLILQCASQVPAAVELTATDNVDGSITTLPTEVVTPGASVNDFTVLRTWTFADQAGNFSAISQTITVLDTVPPVAPAVQADVTFTTDAVPTPSSLTVTDNCDGPVTVTPTIVVTPGSSPNDFTLDVAWTFVDLAGNSSGVSQTINVVEPELELTGCTIFATGTAAVFGTNGDDVICGDDANNIIYALGGNDIVLGFGGNDLIFLGNNGTGGVTVTADFGQSSWTISAAHDVAWGGAGNDRIYGGNGSDEIYGGTGDDQLWGQNEDDTLIGGAINGFFEITAPGYPLAVGAAGNDKAVGGNGSDFCFASIEQTCEISLS